MKKIVYALLFLVFTFLFNVVLYYYSDSYSFFLKKIKYGDEIIIQWSKEITDAVKENTPAMCDCQKEIDSVCGTFGKQNDTSFMLSSGALNREAEFNEFFSFFDKNTFVLKNYDEYYKIFDITDEYPKEYFTYTSEQMEIYLFSWGKYNDLYNLFELLSTYPGEDKKFSLNKANNFWKKTFYINLEKDDGNVRLVVDNWKILFWLKVKKSYYNEVKKILEKL